MKYSMALGLGGLAAVSAHPQRRSPNPDPALSRRGVDLSKFTIPGLGSYTQSSEIDTSSFSASSAGDYIEAATQLVKEVAPGATFRLVDDHYVNKIGIGHVNFKQTVHGLDVDNGDFNVNVRKDGSILSHGGSFFKGKIPEESPLNKRDFADPVAALKGAIEALSLPIEADENTVAESNLAGEGYTLVGTTGATKDPEALLTYLAVDGELRLVWRLETDVVDNWLLTYVDATTTTDVVGVVDYVSDVATYEVYPWGINDPTDGDRVIAEDPWLLSASPYTWLSDGVTNRSTTWGNNGMAHINAENNLSMDPDAYVDHYRPVSEDLKFEYPYSLEETDPKVYYDASVAQLFYSANKLHDVLYVLGFDEAAGNFQTDNAGLGGRGDDVVILNAQDGSGLNNANFATPPDGQAGRMRMYLWNRSPIRRDCSFDAGVVIHEYVHGLSNRLTGGPANAGCLPSGEPGGMGEGWSDFFATAIRLRPNDTRATDYPMGDWVANNPRGIRSYPYSTSLTTNPHTYKDLSGLSAVHAIGTVWASILYEVLWNLIDTHGKNDGEFPDLDAAGVPTDGKFLALKLVQEGLALQPCRPDFIAARNAIIDADVAFTDGANACDIWRGFAKRGLGPKAVRSPRTEDFEVPAECA